MLYQIENKYYIKVAPMRYTEVKFILKNDDVVIQPTQNRIESDGRMVITEFNFQKEKDSIKSDLLKQKCDGGVEKTTTTKYRKRR